MQWWAKTAMPTWPRPGRAVSRFDATVCKVTPRANAITADYSEMQMRASMPMIALLEISRDCRCEPAEPAARRNTMPVAMITSSPSGCPRRHDFRHAPRHTQAIQSASLRVYDIASAEAASARWPHWFPRPSSQFLTPQRSTAPCQPTHALYLSEHFSIEIYKHDAIRCHLR